MSNRTLRVYSDEELAFGRRRVSVLVPAESTVKVRELAAESFDEPLFRLPEGWVDMSVAEIGDWATGEAARLGRIQRHGVASGQGCPKGDWDDEAVPVVRATGCPCCASTSLEERPDLERGWACMDCGYGSTDSHRYLPDAGPDRQPGDGWFGGTRPGSAGLYRDDESAAARTVYHEGEPVVPIDDAPTIESYPGAWDWPAVAPAHPDGPFTPGEAAARRARAHAKTKRDVRVFLGS